MLRQPHAEMRDILLWFGFCVTALASSVRLFGVGHAGEGGAAA